MLSEQPISQSTWHEGIDVDLAARLLTSTSEPGVVSMRVARRLLGWIEYLELRRALAASIAQRWAGAGHLRAPDHPIVHAGWISSPPADTASPNPRAALPSALQLSVSLALAGGDAPEAGAALPVDTARSPRGDRPAIAPASGAAPQGAPRRVTRGEPLSPAPLAPVVFAREAPALAVVHGRPVSVASPGAAAEPSIRSDRDSDGSPHARPLRGPSTSPLDSARIEAGERLGRAVEPMEKALARGLADSMRAGASKLRASRSDIVSAAPEPPPEGAPPRSHRLVTGLDGARADIPTAPIATSDMTPPASPLPRVAAVSPARAPAPGLRHRIEGGGGSPGGAEAVSGPLADARGSGPLADARGSGTLADARGSGTLADARGSGTLADARGSGPLADARASGTLVWARGRSRAEGDAGDEGALSSRPVVRPSNFGPTLSDLRRALAPAAVKPRPPSADRASASPPLVPAGARGAGYYEDASGPPSAAGRAPATSIPGERAAPPRREPPEATVGREPRIDVESIVDQVQRRLMKQLAVERERRGARR